VTENVELLRLFGLDGQVALVTGAAVGIGKATARLLADAGARVVIADKDIAGAQAVAAEIEGALAIGFDLANDASITAMIGMIEDRFGRLDILVNNAAIFPKYPFDALTEPQWHEMQQINVWGCFVVMRAAATLMRKGGRGGAIITVSSVGSPRTAVHNQIAYNASKAAIDSMTISAAYELAPDNIRVNSIQPGAVRPLDPRPHPPGHQSPTGPLTDPGRILLGRPALAEEVAGPILMLAGAAGAYITGQAIVVDGGFFIS
jgi:NAD(P)-dependent dehydrogenase (short-subunit alcohol dehydrogenase family)